MPTDLSGAAEHQGDLKSVVLHKMTMNSVQSTFPIALGLRITGVDDQTFSQTGEIILDHRAPQRQLAHRPHPAGGQHGLGLRICS